MGVTILISKSRTIYFKKKGAVITIGRATGGKIVASRKQDHRGIIVDGHLKNLGVNFAS
jgi:hypothetical protein